MHAQHTTPPLPVIEHRARAIQRTLGLRSALGYLRNRDQPLAVALRALLGTRERFTHLAPSANDPLAFLRRCGGL